MSRFLVDAQLPRRLAKAMQASGLDAVHTLDLPSGNATKDSDINRISLEQQRVVVTKDADFVRSFILQDRPYKLLLVTTGNISNAELLDLFESRFQQLSDLFGHCNFIELTQKFLLIHS